MNRHPVRPVHGISVLVLALCAFPIAPRAEQPEDFLDRQNITSIAVLPPMGDSAPSAARQLSAETFITKLKLRRAACRIIGPEEVVSRLDAAGLLSELTSFVNMRAQTGIVSRDPLKRIGRALETDGLLLIHVLNYTEQKGSWWYGRGGRNLGRIEYALFASSSGDKVWESLEFRQHDSKLSTRPYPMERVIGDITDKAVTSILTGTQNTDVRKKKRK